MVIYQLGRFPFYLICFDVNVSLGDAERPAEFGLLSCELVFGFSIDTKYKRSGAFSYNIY